MKTISLTLFVFTLLLFTSCSQDLSPSVKNKETTTLAYKIVERDDTSLGMGKNKINRMVIKILFNSQTLPTRDSMKISMEKVAKEEDNNLDKLLVAGYLSGMPLSDGCYACAEFQDGVLTNFEVNDWALLQTKWESYYYSSNQNVRKR